MASPVQYYPLRLEGSSQLPSAGVHYDEESISDTLCGTMAQRPGGLFYCESMDLANDPRFLHDTILDKRLAAFTALSIIASISTGAVCDNFFPFFEAKHLILLGKDQGPWDVVRVVMQLSGFVMMSFVLFLDIIATIVFGAQFYYTYKLMTSGPIGFESARGFYKDPKMTDYRSKAALGLIVGLPLFVLAIGCMLYVKFDLALKEEKDDDGFLHHSLCLACFGVFLCMALCICRVSMDHQRTFSLKCRQSSHVQPLLEHLNSDRTPRSARGSLL